MPESKNGFFTHSFSHIYAERDALRYPLAKMIIGRFPKAVLIQIDGYKDVFARSKQHFAAQKKSPKLILAVKKPPFVYPGAPVCHDFGNTHFYYTSSVLNCLYNCDYCFLQGMFPSANIVVFVNTEDIFAEVGDMLARHPVYLCVSYETDLLAFESVAPLASRWIAFARGKTGLLLEIRTKSANYRAIEHLVPCENVILAWTLSPESVIRRHEGGTPSLQARLRAARQALADGWKVRLCFDPVLHVENWHTLYEECIEQTFAALPAEKIWDVSVGVFRIPKDYLKTMRKQRPDSPVVHYPYVNENGIMSYPKRISQELTATIQAKLQAYLPEDKIYVFCNAGP